MTQVSDNTTMPSEELDTQAVDMPNQDQPADDQDMPAQAPRRKPSPRRFVKRQLNRARKMHLCGEGFSLKGARTWIRRVNRDKRLAMVGKDQMKWAHDHGFSVAQVERFGINESNVATSLSEKEYDLLYPINGRYGKWIDDRVTSCLVAGKLADRFERMHLNLISRNGELLVIPMSDNAKTACDPRTGTAQDLRAFLEANRGLRLTVSGTQWTSPLLIFIQLTEEGYLWNETPVTFEELVENLVKRANKNPLVVFEAAPRDASLMDKDSLLLGGVRLTVCNPTGNDPFIGDAYMRIIDTGQAKDEATDEEGDSDTDADVLVDGDAVENPLDENEVFETTTQSRVRFYAAPISLEGGTYNGARAMMARGAWEDTPVILRTGETIQGAILHWDQIKREICELFLQMPQVEFAEISLRSSADGYRIVRFASFPTFNRAYPFPQAVQTFLKDKAAEKASHASTGRLSRVNHAAFLRLRREYTKLLFPKGMVYYQGIRYPHDVMEDLFSRNGIPLGKKLWCYRHGFLSYRLDLYRELDDSNWQDFIADFEYRWLRHINPEYRKWMEDKISLKYVAAPYSQYLPGYYYYISCRAGENRIVAMMDLPQGYGTTIQDVLRLARECGVLALKPDAGSHGEGFYKLTYKDGVYALNDEPATEERITSILTDPNNQYLVSEYLELHPDLKAIYPGAVNTVRVTVFKRDGVNPQIGNAYLRIGSSRTGAVDNVVAGGFVAEVDVDTGRFGNARTLVKNQIVFENVHPDTGTPMEGQLPNWDIVRKGVLDMARSIPQLEYLGFDVAITQEGFKLVEVNRYPDYPRISRLTPQTISYLRMKIEDKKVFRNIAENRSLFKLPRRDA